MRTTIKTLGTTLNTIRTKLNMLGKTFNTVMQCFMKTLSKNFVYLFMT